MGKNGMAIVMIVALLVLLPLLFKLFVFAMNGKKGLDYYITRAELTGDGNRIVRDSGRVRAFQPVIEFLLCAGLFLCAIGYIVGDGTASITAWLHRYGLCTGLALLGLLAVIVFAVRLRIAGQMRENPLDMDALPAGQEYNVVGTRNPKRIQLLSGLSAMLFFLSPIWCIALTSEYVSRSLMLFLLLLTLGLMLFVLWKAHQERRIFVRIMKIDCRGIQVFRMAESPDPFIPWKDISSMAAADKYLKISRICSDSGAPDRIITVPLENSLVRGETIVRIADQYSGKAGRDRQ